MKIEKPAAVLQPAWVLPEPVPGPASAKRLLLIAALLCVLGAALFSASIKFEFLNYDDDAYVYRNRNVLNGLSLSGIRYALTSSDIGTWAPLTWLSYECDTSLLGARASSYRTTNILLHAAAGGLLFLALCLMRQSLWVSLTVAVLFLVHPLRTESVVWIAERKDVLCAFFWMLGLVAYARYAPSPSLRRWSAVFLCFLAGLMSKMMMVTFPFVLLLLDFWPLKRFELSDLMAGKRIGHLLLEKLPFFAAIPVVIFISASALNSRGAFATRQSEGLSSVLRIPQNYVFYLEKIFWPGRLSILYPIQPVEKMAAALCAALLALLTLALVWKIRKMPWLTVGWLWFIGTLVPVVGFVPFGDFVVADRYTYLPSIGLVWGVVVLVEQLAPGSISIRWTATIAISLACASITAIDLSRWQNSLALYNAALQIGPHYVAYTNRGMALQQAGEFQAAFDDYTAAIKLNPTLSRAYNNRGSVLAEHGRFDEGLRDFDAALQHDPNYGDAYANRGTLLAHKGEPERALRDYERSIKLDPFNTSHYNSRAAVYLQLKRLPEAKTDLERCEQLGGQPDPGLLQALADALKANP